MKRITFLLSGIPALIALLLGCAGAVPAATPTSLAKPNQVELPDAVLAIYHKTGGIAGIDQTLTVHQGGLLEYTSRGENPKSLQVNEPILLPLRNTLNDPAFAELGPSYQAEGADLITYTITARDSTGTTRTIMTTDSANHPPFLGLVIGMFEMLLTIVSKNG